MPIGLRANCQMSKALQRLLGRPSSLTFLTYLLRASNLDDALLMANKTPCICRRRIRYRPHTTATARAPAMQISLAKGVEDDPVTAEINISETTKGHAEPKLLNPRATISNSILPTLLYGTGVRPNRPRPWLKYLTTFEEFEYQSNIELRVHGKEKLVDNPRYNKDLTLWATLVDFRKRNHGDEGVAMLWKGIRERGLQLPTEKALAYRLWPTFLQTGLKNREMLSDICRHADELYDSSGKRWPGLYIYIMERIIDEGYLSIMAWHPWLIACHPPSPGAFSRLVHNVVSRRGDLKALRLLYWNHKGHKTYDEMMPVLIEHRDFEAAYEWHSFLIERGDVPSRQGVVKPLIDYLGIYDPVKARKLIQSLVSAQVSFTESLSTISDGSKVITREMINLAHGKTFGISPKTYNDRLGARWFATNWISMDLAISTIHALGIQEIGPLSLQSIGLREVDPSGFVGRLNQLKELGISTGSTVFSKAVTAFARNGHFEYLQGLLRSDQHPDSYEDRKLQESLLASYARASDWINYRLTAAILLVGSNYPRIAQENLYLRAQIVRRDRNAILQQLEEMRMERVPITPTTVTYILRELLQSRQRGHGPDPGRDSISDLKLAISILMSIIRCGGYVSVASWREIIRRLGMLGRFYDLETLCLWLAVWYQPNSKFRLRSITYHISPAFRRRYIAPSQVRSSHPHHPLRILFSDPLQRAIVEWGFRHVPLRQPLKSTVFDSLGRVNSSAQQSHHPYTRGVRLLRQLKGEGVHISRYTIRCAIKTRFAILYGPGESRLRRNRLLKQQNVFTRKEMQQELTRAWGEDLFFINRRETALRLYLRKLRDRKRRGTS